MSLALVRLPGLRCEQWESRAQSIPLDNRRLKQAVEGARSKVPLSHPAGLDVSGRRCYLDVVNDPCRLQATHALPTP